MSECHVFVYEVSWCDWVDEWVSFVCVWSKNDEKMLLSECHVFVYEIRMMWWCCWVSVMCLSMKWRCCGVSAMCLCMKWGICDDVDEWVSCACVWSKDLCDDVVEWVSFVCVWRQDDVMNLLTECHVLVYEVRMMWWCCWVSVMCLCMKWWWCDEVVEWVLFVCVLS